MTQICKNLLNMPNIVVKIIETIEKEGFSAYAIGGCVRDYILGNIPHDWDIATSALPHHIKSIFKHTYDTGIKHGTVTVIEHGEKFEITTFRKETKYSDYRRPADVKFCDNLYEDTQRRDFTINSIAWHPQKGIIDYHDGIGDIQKKIIRAIGEPEKRFEEDALRMLRAIRFCAKLNFAIEQNTLNSIKECCHLIQYVSSERIRDELSGIIMSDNPLKFILLRDTNLLQYIMPEFEICFHTEQRHPYHIYNVASHILHSVANIEKDLILRWTMLFHDIGKPLSKSTDEDGVDHFYGHCEESVRLADNIMKRLKFDNHSRQFIIELIKLHDIKIIPDEKFIRKMLCRKGEKLFEMMLKVQEADSRAQNLQLSINNVYNLAKAKEIAERLLCERKCFTLKDLKISGKDLIEIGFEQGPKIGKTLNYLLDVVINEPEKNDRDILIELAREKLMKSC